jgi:serine/threonine protein kinase
MTDSDLDQKMVENFVQEGIIMKNFNHPHVLSLLGLCLGFRKEPMVILPFMANGDLRTFVKDKSRVSFKSLFIQYRFNCIFSDYLPSRSNESRLKCPFVEESASFGQSGIMQSRIKAAEVSTATSVTNGSITLEVKCFSVSSSVQQGSSLWK